MFRKKGHCARLKGSLQFGGEYIEMNNKSSESNSVKLKCFLWFTQFALGILYILAALLVDGNMELLYFEYPASLVVIIILTVLIIVNATVLYISRRTGIWFLFVVVIVCIFLWLPAFL